MKPDEADLWVTTCGGREEGESGAREKHWRVEGEAAERVLAFVRGCDLNGVLLDC